MFKDFRLLYKSLFCFFAIALIFSALPSSVVAEPSAVSFIGTVVDVSYTQDQDFKYFYLRVERPISGPIRAGEKLTAVSIAPSSDTVMTCADHGPYNDWSDLEVQVGDLVKFKVSQENYSPDSKVLLHCAGHMRKYQDSNPRPEQESCDNFQVSVSMDRHCYQIGDRATVTLVFNCDARYKLARSGAGGKKILVDTKDVSSGRYTINGTIVGPAGSRKLTLLAGDSEGDAGYDTFHYEVGESSCRSHEDGPQKSQQIVLDHTMCEHVEEDEPGNPIIRKNTFSSRDEKAVAWIKFGELHRSRTVLWKFYQPNGELYYTTSRTIPKPESQDYDYWNWYAVWAWIDIDGSNAASLLGRWKVKIYLDESYVLTESFTIRS